MPALPRPLEDVRPVPLTLLIQAESRGTIAALLRCLPGREHAVLRLLYGLGGETARGPYDHAHVAELLGLSLDDVIIAERNALALLRRDPLVAKELP